MTGKRIWWLILGTFWTGSVSLAQETNQAPPFSESMGASLARAGFALFLVIALIFLAVWLLKRYFPQFAGAGTMHPKSTSQSELDDRIEILDVKGIAPKRFLILAKVHDREVLIGSTEDGLTALGDWKAGESPEDQLEEN